MVECVNLIIFNLNNWWFLWYLKKCVKLYEKVKFFYNVVLFFNSNV